MKNINLFFSFLFISSLILTGCDISGKQTASTPTASSGSSSSSNSNELIIQESATITTGYLGASPGTLQNAASCTGFTGAGYIGSNSGIGANINWSVNAASEGNYDVCWCYAFGGTSSYLRNAKIVVNGVVIATLTSTETGGFTYTATTEGGKNNVYKLTKTVTIPLKAGDNHVRLEAIGSYYNASNTWTGALANIDYIKFIGNGLTAGSSSLTTYHPITITVNDSTLGSASVSPVKDYYAKGESVTATAVITDSSNYFLGAWEGLSSLNPYTFTITGDTKLNAQIYPNSKKSSSELIGYGAVQNDTALNSYLTGGSAATTATTVTTYSELKATLESSTGTTPLDIIVSGLITTTDNVSVSLGVPANTTIRGDGTGHLKNIELKISSNNVIIRDLIMSEVIAWDDYKGAGNDCIQINGAKYVWIHHCEFYSNLNAGGDTISSISANADYYKDYYDGLLDVKNAASFITVSWCKFHDHWKALLLGSGDTSTGDSVLRITFHHNYFLNCISRLPLIRFGKAHIYNNYFFNDGIGETSASCINSRCGAEVFVENNYFKNSKDLIGFYYDTSGLTTGTWNVSNNTYDNCTGDQPTASTTTYAPLYTYTADAASVIISTITTSDTGAGVRNPVP